jgi:hypothetical protein
MKPLGRRDREVLSLPSAVEAALAEAVEPSAVPLLQLASEPSRQHSNVG